MSQPHWSVAIFTARESIETLGRCIGAARIACHGHHAQIDVLVNGNRELADAAASFAASVAGEIPVQVWYIALGDKAHTWNMYVHDIWTESAHSFFIDGYTELRPESLTAMKASFDHAPDALCVSGVPSSGRTATALKAQLIRENGVHGNLYGLHHGAMVALRDSAFKLPLGLYRTDPLMGAALKFRLDPANHRWDASAIAVATDATWDVQQKASWTRENIKTSWRRKLRQAQGQLENRAARDHLAVHRRPANALPRLASELVIGWLKRNPRDALRQFLANPLTLYATRQLQRHRDWSQADIAPLLVSERPLRTGTMHSR